MPVPVPVPVLEPDLEPDLAPSPNFLLVLPQLLVVHQDQVLHTSTHSKAPGRIQDDEGMYAAPRELAPAPDTSPH